MLFSQSAPDATDRPGRRGRGRSGGPGGRGERYDGAVRQNGALWKGVRVRWVSAACEKAALNERRLRRTVVWGQWCGRSDMSNEVDGSVCTVRMMAKTVGIRDLPVVRIGSVRSYAAEIVASADVITNREIGGIGWRIETRMK